MFKINAAQRLKSTEVIAAGDRIDLYGMPASHLSKKSGTLEDLSKVATRKPSKVVGIGCSKTGGEIKKYFFLGSAADLKFGSKVSFKNMTGVVDLIADITKDGSVSITNKGSKFDSNEKRPFYVFK